MNDYLPDWAICPSENPDKPGINLRKPKEKF